MSGHWLETVLLFPYIFISLFIYQLTVGWLLNTMKYSGYCNVAGDDQLNIVNSGKKLVSFEYTII